MVSFKEFLLLNEDINSDIKTIESNIEKFLNDLELDGDAKLNWVDVSDNPEIVKNIIILQALYARNKFKDCNEEILPKLKNLFGQTASKEDKAIGAKILEINEVKNFIKGKTHKEDELKKLVSYLDSNEDKILEILSGEKLDDTTSDTEDTAGTTDDPDQKDGPTKTLDVEDEKDTEDEKKSEDEKQKSKVVGAKNLSATFGSLPVRELKDALNAGDLNKSREALDKWKKQVEDKISEFIDAKNNEVEENKKYLREEKEILWEGILQNFKDRKDVKYKKEKGVKSIYDGDTNTSHYIEQLDNIFNQTEAKIEKICGRINDYNISNKERNEIKQRALNIIDNLINSSYSLIRDVKKNTSKTRFLERNRINNAKQKEREDEEYENSFRGEDLKKKASIFAQNFADTFVAAFKVNHVKNIDDIAKRQILDLIAESDGDVQTFIKLVNSKQVLSPIDGEPVMYAIRWLSNKGLKVPSNISSKDIDLMERKPEVRGIKEAFELIKQKIGTEVTPPYPDGVIANIVKNVRNIADKKDPAIRQSLINKLLASKENKEYPNEVKIIANKFMVSLDNKPQDEQANTNNQNNKLTPEQEKQAKEIEEMSQQQKQNEGLAPASASATVTTAKCDGLPIGARKYSRAIRRRMNYALNKYM